MANNQEDAVDLLTELLEEQEAAANAPEGEEGK
jgi:hypothetical protein